MKIKINNKPEIIRKKDINTYIFSLVFAFEYIPQELYHLNLLGRMIDNYTYKYHDCIELNRHKEELFISDLAFEIDTYFNNGYVIYTMEVPKEGILDDFNIKACVKLFIEELYKPYVTKKEFNNEALNFEKDYIYNSLKNITRDKIDNFICDYEDALIDPEEKIRLRHKSKLKILKSIDGKSLYNYYEKIILNNKPKLFATGDFDEKYVIDLFKDYIVFDYEESIINRDTTCQLKFLNGQTYNIPYSFKQSAIIMHYFVKNYNYSDKYNLILLHDLLSRNASNLLFKKLRIDNNIVYICDAYTSLRNGVLFIETRCSYNNVNKIISLIYEVLEELKDKKLLKEKINKIIEDININIIRNKDRKYYKYNYKIDKYKNIDTNEEIVKHYKKININNFISFIESLELSDIMIFEESNHD